MSVYLVNTLIFFFLKDVLTFVYIFKCFLSIEISFSSSDLKDVKLLATCYLFKLSILSLRFKDLSDFIIKLISIY